MVSLITTWTPLNSHQKMVLELYKIEEKLPYMVSLITT